MFVIINMFHAQFTFLYFETVLFAITDILHLTIYLSTGHGDTVCDLRLKLTI